MGCLQSKKDCGDIHPNVFRVLNIDDAGNDLWSGQLEVTETDLVLYREGRDATVWPLACLRRYGFDGEIFSFESGRRCATGEGIYAFRCRRAGMLFSTLQQNIQLRNVVHDSLSFQMPPAVVGGSPASVPRPTLQATVVHRSSVDSGLPARNPVHLMNQSRQTVSNHIQTTSNIENMESTPQYPRTDHSNNITNLYQFKNFKSKESNNNHEKVAIAQHAYSNDISKDLAFLRHSLHQETALNMIKDREDELLMSGHCNNNGISGTLVSPTLSNGEKYVQLNPEQDQARLYMNLVPSECVADNIFNPPQTPLTPKQPEYCNLNLATNSYANLSLGEIADSITTAKQMTHGTEVNHKFSESDTFTSMSPIEELELSYAVLDIDANKDAGKTQAKELSSPSHQPFSNSRQESTGSHSSALVQKSSQGSDSTIAVCSPTTLKNIGYTTIDFDKTVALTSVAAETDLDSDGYRKTRHNSTAT